MPAHINYETTPIIFYKFVCENPEIKSCYVGHTTNFMNRRRQHKGQCNNNISTKYGFKVYQTIRDNGGWTKWKMVEINRQICLDKIQACKTEQQYIEELQSDMNMKNAYTNKNEYQKSYDKKYKLKKAEKNKQKFDCECGGKYTFEHKSRHLKSLKHLKYCKNILNI